MPETDTSSETIYVVCLDGTLTEDGTMEIFTSNVVEVESRERTKNGVQITSASIKLH